MSENRTRGNRGRRYSNESKLNYAKILAVLIAVAVVIMFVIAIKELLSFDFATFNSKTEYFALYSEDKWGVIDSKGEVVITPSYAEMIVIPDSTQDVFLCTYEIDAANGTYKTKALDKKSKEIFTEYEQIEALENYDKNQNVWHEKNLLKVKQNGKYGLIDLDGKTIINCDYDEIYTLKGIENSIIIEKNGQVGLIDSTGRIIIETIYKEIKPLGTEALNGYITINQEGKYGVVAANKDHKLENNYEKIEQIYGSNLYVIVEKGKQKLINSKGTALLEQDFDEIKQILQKNNDQVVFVKDGKYGVMTTSGEIKIENIYEDIKELENGYLVAKKDDKYGIIDNANNVKLGFSYTSISYNKEADLYIAEDTNFQSSIIDKNFEVKLIGILSELNAEQKYIKMYANEEYKYYNLNFEEKLNTEVLKANTLFLSKKDGKYGYVNSKGEVVVDYIYDDATEQNKFGYAAVQKNGLWGSIDNEGNVVIEPTYDLDNNIIIDLIGKWHLGEDLNMNYYCDK